MPVKLFFTSVSSNLEIKKHQQKIEMILDSLKIPYENVDISQKEENKVEMRRIAGNPVALPPQICNGDIYCGDFKAFEEAVESEELHKFLKV
ncbi:SH3 domain-binding glutamic acid-rich-like protein 3 [Hippoglossus stenolepis]|uniref:SH3 domain-binding glutamic acid-rich-like protein 3 n=1 Tax=Hippoglossus stenolepis TaxID=195615 RepID=UPI00159CB9C0|nr:SH3 domain-binding glutamic acid-rich-like protein 3 [Hippoglossus stenolepis]